MFKPVRYLFFTPYVFLRVVFLGLFCVLVTLYAQAQRTCGTPQAIKEALQKHPSLLKKYQEMQRLTLTQPLNKSYFRGGAPAIIPVVIHIVLTNPQEVTDAQVLSQINALNIDYSASNEDTSRVPAVWKSLIGDMNIQFCLAQRTPAGDPSNGIVRTRTDLQTFSILNGASDVKHQATGGDDAWDGSRYLNIWVCNMGGNNLGIGTPPGLFPEDEEGVVIQYNAFGTTGNLLPAFNKGRTCTHELGHYFNLSHPWGDTGNSCSPGDYVADTPPQYSDVYDCPAFPYLSDRCSTTFPGVMFMNFMEYVNDSCMQLFTNGQVARAQAALIGPRASLLTSDGCQPVVLKGYDAAISRVIAPLGKLCIGNITPSVTLKNKGSHPLTSVSLHYRIDGGTPQTFAWTGQVASLDSIQVTLPATSVPVGPHRLVAYSAQPNGQPDEQAVNDTAQAAFHLDPEAVTPFLEDFEKDSFPPPGWDQRNPDNGLTWEKTTIASHSGEHAVVMHNLDYAQNGPMDDLITPVFNIQQADSAFLFFWVAAAVQSDPRGNNTYWDTLQVLLSRDCGQSGTSLYKKWGETLITDTLPVSGEFVPTTRQWRRDSIDLTPYLDQGKFQLIFRNVTNYENNIYLDDIQVITRETNPILEKEKVIVVPNPTTGTLNIQFLGHPSALEDVSIFNTLGQRIARKDAADLDAQNRIEFNLAGEANGVYFVNILYSDHAVVKKIVKIK